MLYDRDFGLRWSFLWLANIFVLRSRTAHVLGFPSIEIGGATPNQCYFLVEYIAGHFFKCYLLTFIIVHVDLIYHFLCLALNIYACDVSSFILKSSDRADHIVPPNLHWQHQIICHKKDFYFWVNWNKIIGDFTGWSPCFDSLRQTTWGVEVPRFNAFLSSRFRLWSLYSDQVIWPCPHVHLE